MGRMFPMAEDDLATLEMLLPDLCSALYPCLKAGNQGNRLRVKLRQCKKILSDIRWNYGPPQDVEIIPCDDIPPIDMLPDSE